MYMISHHMSPLAALSSLRIFIVGHIHRWGHSSWGTFIVGHIRRWSHSSLGAFIVGYIHRWSHSSIALFIVGRRGPSAQIGALFSHSMRTTGCIRTLQRDASAPYIYHQLHMGSEALHSMRTTGCIRTFQTTACIHTFHSTSRQPSFAEDFRSLG